MGTATEEGGSPGRGAGGPLPGRQRTELAQHDASWAAPAGVPPHRQLAHHSRQVVGSAGQLALRLGSLQPRLLRLPLRGRLLALQRKRGGAAQGRWRWRPKLQTRRQRSAPDSAARATQPDAAAPPCCFPLPSQARLGARHAPAPRPGHLQRGQLIPGRRQLALQRRHSAFQVLGTDLRRLCSRHLDRQGLHLAVTGAAQRRRRRPGTVRGRGQQQATATTAAADEARQAASAAEDELVGRPSCRHGARSVELAYAPMHATRARVAEASRTGTDCRLAARSPQRATLHALALPPQGFALRLPGSASGHIAIQARQFAAGLATWQPPSAQAGMLLGSVQVVRCCPGPCGVDWRHLARARSIQFRP